MRSTVLFVILGPDLVGLGAELEELAEPDLVLLLQILALRTQLLRAAGGRVVGGGGVVSGSTSLLSRRETA